METVVSFEKRAFDKNIEDFRREKLFLPNEGILTIMY